MLGWLNIYGLVFMAVIMIPNIVFAVRCRDGFENRWKNRVIGTLEQFGRFGCFGFMILYIPGTWFGFPSDEAFAVYLIADSVLIAAYCLIWMICFRKNSVFRALALSILPSEVFLLSGVLSRSVLLIAAAVVFAPCHILQSLQNAVLDREEKRRNL